ncbi:MAG: GntR family transcriptional regulator [Bilifractor sp.]|jgi:GntR family transcriptional regulator
METELDRNSSTPLYMQLEDIIRANIADGEWPPLQMVPSENELSKMYGISRMTARSVITTLVKEGLLYRVQGKGTYVAEPKISTKSPAYLGLREQLESQGYATETRIITFELIRPNRKIAQALSIPQSTKVYHIKRVRSISETPISIHESYIPNSLCPDLRADRIETEQLCDILESDYHLNASRVHEILESVSPTSEEMSLLKIDKKNPLLLLYDTNYSITGKPFEYSKIVFRGDKLKLEFDYER